MKTSRAWMYALVFAAACAEPGDSEQVDTSPANTEIEQIGTVQLKLTATDSSGRSYRLRSADFQIFDNGFFPPFPGFPGYDAGTVNQTNITVSSETDPDSPFITQRLVPGQYSVALLDSGWYLERLGAAGWERVSQAVLLSPAYQYVYVYDGGTSDVLYTFGVDGELIDFRAGEVRIGISVEQPGDDPYPNDGGSWQDGGMDVRDADVAPPQDAGIGEPETDAGSAMVGP